MSPGGFVGGLESAAAELVPEAVFRYLAQGARAGVSAAEATAAWESYRFRPHTLRGPGEPEVATTVLGTPVRTPLAVAPTTMQRAVCPEGEVATARGARAAGALMVLSSNAGSTFADVAGTGVDWWLQLYLSQERDLCRPVLESALACGARAVVLTVDTPVVGSKDDGDEPTVWDLAQPGWVRANFALPDGPGARKATDLGVRDVAWLAAQTGLPVVVKGVLRGDDALEWVRAGAAAVWVSNHGGRQLDRSVSTAECLGEVVDAVGTHVEVYVDGGVRTGAHALTGLALGASAVFLGRLPVYALAAQGAAGVERLFAALDEELVEALRLCGCLNLGDLSPDLVQRTGGGDRASRKLGEHPWRRV